ncbi:MAG TPA: aminopeptidase P N-terminal domain-containing protein [Pyrinomonadaceae bacterium]|nr:aminopeptidase P N-terminal domain-containing protein [Pyrinomonadaceae bacterium]
MIRSQLKEFMKRMEPDSVAIIPAAHEVTRSYDSHYRFRQDSDFLYLTGFPEPDAVAVIAPSNTKNPFTLFVRPSDPLMETWNGKRYGVAGALKQFGATRALPIESFAKEFPKLVGGHEKLYYRFGRYDHYDKQILEYYGRQRFSRQPGAYPPAIIIDPSLITHEMRLIKDDAEAALMQKAADISAAAHVKAMKMAKPNMGEHEIEAMMESYFRQKGAVGPAYTSIVGAGANATILHYIENNGTLGDGELLLIDAGAEYDGYAADITRTFPVNGKYSPAQRDVYDIVLETQKACCEITRVGSSNVKRQQLAIEMLTEGMVKIGLLKGKPKDLIRKKTYLKYYMHGLGHYLGLDVHDAGRYFSDNYVKNSRPFEAGMVLTVEPGIYVPADDKTAPPKYRGIGIRVEDDVLITKDGNINLTSKVPKEREEIEDLMSKGKAKAAAK